MTKLTAYIEESWRFIIGWKFGGDAETDKLFVVLLRRLDSIILRSSFLRLREGDADSLRKCF